MTHGHKQLLEDLTIDRVIKQVVRHVKIHLRRGIPQKVSAVARKKTQLRGDIKQFANTRERFNGAEELLQTSMRALGMVEVSDKKIRLASLDSNATFAGRVKVLIAEIQKRGVRVRHQCYIVEYRKRRVACVAVWINDTEHYFVTDLTKLS